MNKRTESLIKNTTILTFGMICTKGLMFIMTPLFTRWLTANDYGTFDLMITYISLLVPLFSLSVGEAVFRNTLNEISSEKKQSIIFSSLIISLTGSGVAFLSIMLYTSFAKKDCGIMFCFALFFVGEMFFSFCTYLLRGLKNMNAYTIGNIIYVVSLSILVPIFVLIFGLNLKGIILGYFFGDVLSIFTMLILGNLKKYIINGKIEKSVIKQILNYSLPMIPNAISWWIINVSDRTIISMILGVSYNAIYAISNKVPALCTTFFSVFHLSWQQNATETMNDADRDFYYSKVMNNMFCIISSICIVVISLNYWFFKLLFSEYYFIGIYHSPILVLAIIFSMLAQFIGGIYVAQMKSKKNGLTTSLAASANILVNIFLISNLKLYAASISTFIAYFSLFIVRYIDINNSIKLKFDVKSVSLFACLLLVTLLSYIHIVVVQIVLFIVSIIIFGIVNKQFLKKIIRTFMPFS